jgi:hypothetical protein
LCRRRAENDFLDTRSARQYLDYYNHIRKIPVGL